MAYDGSTEQREVEEDVQEEVEVIEEFRDEEDEVITSMAEESNRNVNLYKMYYTFNGDVKGPIKTGQGDQHVFGRSDSSSEISFYPLGDKEINKVRRVYEPVGNYNLLREHLQNKHLLVLNGMKQTGKFTTALHLLLNTGVEEFIEIYPDTLQKQLVDWECSKNTGYIIDGYAHEIDTYLLKALGHKLQEANSYFIITVHGQYKNESHGDFIQNCQSPRRPLWLLQNHLSYHLEDQPDVSLGLLDVVNDIQFRESLEKNLIPSEADQLVNQLVKWHHNEIELYEVFSVLRSYSDKEVENWFSENHSLDEISLLITTAIFHDSPYSKVLDEQKHVLSLLQEFAEDKESEEDEKRTVLEDHQHRLKRLNAKIYKKSLPAEFGTSEVDFIAFNHDTYAQSVLFYVWNAYYPLRKPLLKLLYTYGESTDFQLKTAAQKAIIQFASLDFRSVKELIIQPCASHQRPKVRYFAVETLVKLIRESDELVRVRALLHHWAKLNHPTLTWTAVAAYREIGPIVPDLVLQDLIEISLKNNKRYSQLVQTTMKSIFIEGKKHEELTEKVFMYLKKWYEVAEIKDEVLHVFMSLMTIEDFDNVPFFFSQLEEEELRKNYMIPLLASCINNRSTRKRILTILYESLSICAEKRDWFKTVAESVLETVYVLTPSMQKSMFFTFKSWSENPKRANIAVRKLVELMTKK